MRALGSNAKKVCDAFVPSSIIYANSLHQTVEMWIYLAMANAREGVPSQQIGGLEKFSKISRLFGGSFKCKKNMSKECIPTYLR